MCPPIPVKIITCPVCFSRRRGRVALMKFTWLKKMISNWSRTRFCVAALVESSSTVPTTAIQMSITAIESKSEGWRLPSDVQQSKISILPNTSTASATAAPHCPITRPSHLIPRILSFHPSLSFLPLLHSLINSLNSALRSSSSISWGGRPAAT